MGMLTMSKLKIKILTIIIATMSFFDCALTYFFLDHELFEELNPLLNLFPLRIAFLYKIFITTLFSWIGWNYGHKQPLLMMIALIAYLTVMVRYTQWLYLVYWG